MATKSFGLFLNDVSCIDNNQSNRQFTNLNLNQNHECSEFGSVQSYSKPSFGKVHGDIRFVKLQPQSKKIDQSVYDSSHEKRGSQSCIKSMKDSCLKSLNVLDFYHDEDEEEDEAKKHQMNEHSSNKSTLSLHIAAYENEIEASNKSEANLPLKKLKGAAKNLSSAKLQDPFEYPRQMENNGSGIPEVMQFKASQKLIPSNQDLQTTMSLLSTPRRATSSKVNIQNVWKENLDHEFSRIRQIIRYFPFVAFDTEFPGVVATPGVAATPSYKSREDMQYTQIRDNVNKLKLIQVGFCLINAEGELPPGGDIWQFNLHFSVEADDHAKESIDLLKRSGIDFDRHQTHGIRVEDFGALLTTSGLVVNRRVTWLTFHSCFDFGYLMKTIIGGKLPETENEFFVMHKILFPQSFDIKMVLKCQVVQAAKLRGGLQDIANQLCVERIGVQHQAGSDSLLTAQTFFILRDKFFGTYWNTVSHQFQGLVYGLGPQCVLK